MFKTEGKKSYLRPKNMCLLNKKMSCSKQRKKSCIKIKKICIQSTEKSYSKEGKKVF